MTPPEPDSGGAHTHSRLELPQDGFGPAITKVRENDAGKLWVENGEYATQVAYCPVCGYEAATKPDVGVVRVKNPSVGKMMVMINGDEVEMEAGETVYATPEEL